MRLSHLELDNWKNFTKVEVDLAPRVFIVGPNACGKSNLLDALRFLRDLVTEGGGLAKAIDVRGKMPKVRSLFARAQSSVRIRVTVTDGGQEAWRYDLAFTHKGPREPVPLIVHERVHRLGGDGMETVILDRPDDEDKRDRERLTQTAMQQVTANHAFRELADFFRSITYLHAVPHLMREGLPAPASAIGNDPFGRDLLLRIRSTPPRTQKARLSRIEQVLRVVAPQLEHLSLIQDEEGRPHLQTKFKHWRPQGAYQWETQFSDGTLRLIGLLWALQEKAGPLLLEEPELSLHSAIVRKLAPFIHRAQKSGQGRQVLLSTHSVDLLTDEGISSDELLLVQPGENGSRVVEGAKVAEVMRLMEKNIPASEAVIPRTQAGEITLFDQLSV
jgi:predicted ATPase